MCASPSLVGAARSSELLVLISSSQLSTVFLLQLASVERADWKTPEH